MARKLPAGRVEIQLDTRMTWEALLLDRLERIPRHRRQEWLRALLVQAFQAERRSLRAESPEPRGTPPSEFGRWLSGAAPRPPAPPARTETVACEPGTTKPFAALRKVIG